MTPAIAPTQILLLGAGELGLALLLHINTLSHSHTTIGIRSPSKYAFLTSSTTSLLELDLSSPSPTLIPLFGAFDIVVSATGYASSPDSVLKLANEVLEAGKLREENGQGRIWFFPWQWGVDYDITGDVGGTIPLFGAQKRVRDLLRSRASSSNVEWTVVSTGVFMSFLFESFWGIVDRSDEISRRKIVIRCLRDWDHGVTVTDVHDIGRVLAEILKGAAQSANAVLHVAGDTVTYRELADAVERVSECHVVRETWSKEYLREKMLQDPEDGLKAYRLAFAGEGVHWDRYRTVNRELGVEMMDVETHIRNLFSTKE